MGAAGKAAGRLAWKWMRNWTPQVMSGKRSTQRRKAGRVKGCRRMSKRAVKYLFAFVVVVGVDLTPFRVCLC